MTWLKLKLFLQIGQVPFIIFKKIPLFIAWSDTEQKNYVCKVNEIFYPE